jgi:hypothetical protein
MQKHNVVVLVGAALFLVGLLSIFYLPAHDVAWILTVAVFAMVDPYGPKAAAYARTGAPAARESTDETV